MTVLLGTIIGVCLFAGLNHLVVGERGRRSRMNRALAFFAFAAAFYVFTYFVLYTASSVELYRSWARVMGLAGAALVIGVFWFANVVLRDRVRGVVLAATVVLIGLGVASLLMPAGLFYGEITALRTETGPLGGVTRPVAESNPYQCIFNVAVYLPALWIMVRFVQAYREGERTLALLAGAAFLLSFGPAVVDTFVLGVETFSVPFFEIGMALSLVFLSTVVSEDVARTAGLREHLARTEVRYRWLVESAPDAICVYDPRAERFILSNPQAEALLGLEKDAVETDARALLDRITTAPEDPGIDALLERALEGERMVVECMLIRNGTGVPCELRLSGLPSPRGRLVRLGLADLSDRKTAEAEWTRMRVRLERSQKLQTIGTLAEGIAHDFNNALTPIVGFGELAIDRIEPDHPAADYVTEMGGSGERARELVRQILTYTRGGASGTTVFALEPVVKQALRFVRAMIPPEIELERRLQAPEARIRGVASQVHQIIMNMALNASHAIEDDGTLTVSLVEDSDHVELTVADTGTGMETDTLARIWDPFFTTKASNQGTGLGLTNVRGIVERWGGSIEVESEVGVGTRFRIRLPRVDASEVGVGATRELRSGTETILLVDDDIGVLEAVRRMLDSLGYTVFAYDDAGAALRSLGPGALDLCVADFDMPYIDGVALADRVRQAFPALPVVLVSGSAEGLERRPATPGPWVTLPKPFGRPELSDALRAALDG